MTAENTPWLMGLDLGGGGVRCLLVDAGTGRHVKCSRSWRFETSEGTFGLGFDFDPGLVWQLIGEACRRAIEDAEISLEAA